MLGFLVHLFCGFQPPKQVGTANRVVPPACTSPASHPPRDSATVLQRMMLWLWLLSCATARIRKQCGSVSALLTQGLKQGGNSNSLERGAAPAREQAALPTLKTNRMRRGERSCWAVSSHGEARESAWLKALKELRNRHFSDLLPYFSSIIFCSSHAALCCSFLWVHIYNISQLKYHIMT